MKLLKKHGTRNEDAPPVIRRIHKPGKKPDPLRGLFVVAVGSRSAEVEHEPDTDLRDTERMALQENGGIEAFLRRKVLPYAAVAWYREDSANTGFEISFNRYLYNPRPVRSLEVTRADILALGKETEGLQGEILGATPQRETAERRFAVAGIRPGNREDIG